MKHLVKNNEVIMSGIPSIFTRENGELFYGGYENMTDIHYEDGWRDEIIPTINTNLYRLGNIYYDQVDDICTYDVVPLDINIDNLKSALKDELSQLRIEISNLVIQAKLNYDVEPVELTSTISMIRELNIVAVQEIENLTIDTIFDYVLRGPQVEQLINYLKTFV